MRGLFLKNIGLKIVSLLLAIFVWFLVSELIKQGVSYKQSVSILKTPEIITKYLIIEPRIKGEPAKGFMVVKDRITATPHKSLAVGPIKLLQDANKIYTVAIDIEGEKKTIQKKVPIESIEQTKIGEVEFVDVMIPIEKIK